MKDLRPLTLTMHVLCNTNSNNFRSSHENFIKYMGLRHNALSSTAAVGSKLSQVRKNPRQKLCCKKRNTRIRRFARFLISYGFSTSCSAFLPHVSQKKPFPSDSCNLGCDFYQWHVADLSTISHEIFYGPKHKAIVTRETQKSHFYWVSWYKSYHE